MSLSVMIRKQLCRGDTLSCTLWILSMPRIARSSWERGEVVRGRGWREGGGGRRRGGGKGKGEKREKGYEEEDGG